jgi:hypothetical protein
LASPSSQASPSSRIPSPQNGAGPVVLSVVESSVVDASVVEAAVVVASVVVSGVGVVVVGALVIASDMLEVGGAAVVSAGPVLGSGPPVVVWTAPPELELPVALAELVVVSLPQAASSHAEATNTPIHFERSMDPMPPSRS